MAKENAATRFLKAFSDSYERGNKYTDMALGSDDDSGFNININKDEGSNLAPGVFKVAPDIHVQQGYRAGDWTMPGVEGKKGIAGHLVGMIPYVGEPLREVTGADYW